MLRLPLYLSFLWKYLGDDVEDVKIFKRTGRNGYAALWEGLSFLVRF